MSDTQLQIMDRVAYISLSRPDVMNALRPELLEALDEDLDQIAKSDARIVVIRGEGRAFCAGADLRFISEALEDFAVFARFTRHLNTLLFRLEDLDQPVVAVVHGFALAGGLELMLACDMVLAAKDARIGDQHANFGLMPGGGGTQRLIRKMGYPRALAMLLTGNWIDGTEAERLGLVFKAVPVTHLDEELEELLTNLRGKSREGLGHIKRAVMRGLDVPLRNGIDEELLHAFEFFASSEDPKIGIRAFIEKAKPKFSS